MGLQLLLGFQKLREKKKEKLRDGYMLVRVKRFRPWCLCRR
uniref:Uncharacterized protein n=1 Tax=Anguilla anguilla TaxID=7936 RepID=A0A0E9RVK6_ANGAN